MKRKLTGKHEEDIVYLKNKAQAQITVILRRRTLGARHIRLLYK